MTDAQKTFLGEAVGNANTARAAHVQADNDLRQARAQVQRLEAQLRESGIAETRAWAEVESICAELGMKRADVVEFKDPLVTNAALTKRANAARV